jgi:hypothetical protein
MKANARRGLWCLWSVGTLIWVAPHFGIGGWSWLRTIVGLSPPLPPDQSSPPGMPDLPGDMLLVLFRDAALPPLLVLLVGLLIGWVLGAFWKRQA